MDPQKIGPYVASDLGPRCVEVCTCYMRRPWQSWARQKCFVFEFVHVRRQSPEVGIKVFLRI